MVFRVFDHSGFRPHSSMTRRRKLPREAASSAEREALSGYDALPLDEILGQSFDVDSWPALDELDLIPASTGTNSTASKDTASHSDVSDQAAVPATSFDAIGPTRRRRVPQSQRVRAEQAELRDHIAVLERRLGDLLVARDAARLAAPPTAWRAVATRQAARRRSAEHENKRLHAQLARQRQIARLLEAAIQECIQDFMGHASPRMPPSWCPVQHDVRGDVDRLLDQFMADIEYAYTAVDAVLPGVEYDTTIPLFERPPSRLTVKALASDGGQAPFYTELRQVLALPFSLERVNSVLWQVVSGDYARQHLELERYRYAQGVHACKALVPPSEDNAAAAFTSEYEDTLTSISRLFVETDRTVLMWRAFRTTRKGGGLRNARCVNTGWVVFRPLKTVEDHVVVHACSRSVPQRGTVIPMTRDDPTSPLARTSEVQDFLREMVRAAEDKVPRFVESVENILLDGSSA